MRKITIPEILNEFQIDNLDKVGYTTGELADYFHLSKSSVIETCQKGKVTFINAAEQTKRKPKKLWQLTLEGFFNLRDGISSGKISETKYLVSPYLNLLLTPYWNIYMSYILVEHPMEFIELNVEVSHHPDLIRKLNELMILTPNAGFEEKLAEIAAHCNILLDGLYDGEDQKGIATLCTKRLQEMRTGIIQVIN